MLKIKPIFFFLIIFIFTFGGHVPPAHAQNQDLFTEMNNELREYIKPWQGKISLRYQNLLTGKYYTLNSQTEVPAASTIKLPLALYVMHLADEGKLSLIERLTYQSHHYSGGSGIIQYDPVGTAYTIADLVEKAMIYSDNIAFIMLKERVGKDQFVTYLKKLGASYAYPGGRNMTSADDLCLYAYELFRYSRQNENGKTLLQYLEHTAYNSTIPMGVQGKIVAHKVGMIPMNLIYNDTAVIFDKVPYTLAVATNGIDYEKSQEVIANLASIVDRYHVLTLKTNNDLQTINLALASAKYAVPSTFFTKVPDFYSYLLGKEIFSGISSSTMYGMSVRNNSFHQQLVFLEKSGAVTNWGFSERDGTASLNQSLAQSN
ncbi:serine hydrolase [Bacillus sp. USDA818B3_A]|uniref:serine hydrolase n=1 Tax=Bacillus sp. USDA818B3_A TaxID=2698834 RepID=UPI00136B9D0C|nr:serine hydrolase [Bacillus sp. USDA818B3_A]